MPSFVRLLAAGLSAAALVAGTAATATAQTPAPVSQPQPVVTETREADFSVVNLPTTLSLNRGKSDFHLTHRFLGNLSQGSFSDNLSNVFGLDNGAMVGIGYRIAVTDRLQAVFYRTSVDKTIQFSARVDALRQGGAAPVSISAVASVEGNQNFGWHPAAGATTYKTPALAVTVSRTFEHAALYVVPVFVHNSLVLDDTHRNTFLLGTGARLQLRKTVYLVGEVTPRLSGYAPGKPEFGFGIEKRAGWHVFQLTFSNTTSTTYGQIARGGFPSTIYLGFNLGRKFL